MRMKENLQRSFLVGQSRELWRSHFQLRESIEVLSLLLEIIIVSQLAASHETAVPGVDGVDLSSCGAKCAVCSKASNKGSQGFHNHKEGPS